MKRLLVLRPFVPSDILEITAFLERGSLQRANEFVERLASTLDWLTEHAESGSPKSFSRLAVTGFRTWAVDGFRSYLVVYRINLDTVVVYAVVHGHRDLPTVIRVRV